MKLLLLISLAAFGLGYWLNLPEEGGYDLAEIQAMNELTAKAIQPDDWLSQLVANKEGVGHAK